MSVRMMSLVWELDLPPGEKLVLLALADQGNDEGTQCWPSVETIALRSGQGVRTVRRCLASLEEKGHLTRHHREGTSTQYRIHPCQSGTPASLAPLPKTSMTPANLAPKPLRTTKGSEAKASKPKTPKFILPADIPAEPWRDFSDMRQRLGKPMTERAKELAVTRLRKLRDEDGWPPGDVLNHSTLNSYQGLFPPKESVNVVSLQRNRPNLTALLRASSGDPESGFGTRPALPASGNG